MNNNVAKIIFENAKKFPERVALMIPKEWTDEKVTSYETLTFEQLSQRVKAYTSGIQKSGLIYGDRVILLFPPNVDMYAFILALMASGIISVLIDTGMGIKKFLMAISDAKAKVLISMDAFLKYRFFLPQLWKCEWYSINKCGLKVKPLSYLLDDTSQEIALANVSDDHTALITYTSGSTGRPKGADRTHGCLLNQHLAIREDWPDKLGDIDMTCFPVFVFHNLACGMTTVLPGMNLGTPAKVNPQIIVQQIKENNITRLSGAPAFMAKFCKYIIQNKTTLPSLKTLITGGAPVSLTLCKIMREALPETSINVGYGSTEIEPVSTISIDEILSSKGEGLLVGKPVSEAKVEFVNLPKNPDDINDRTLKCYILPNGEIGELVATGPHVVKRYIDNPEANRENKIPGIAGNVWHRTGDTGYFDKEGRIWLTGRCKDVVNYKGKVLQPYPIELKIDEIPGIIRSALIADKDKNNPLIAIACSLDADKNKIETAVKTWLKEADLLGIKVKFVPEIPVDGRHNSKIDRPTLRKKLVKEFK
ncbi:MAG: AMP-binding protein [Desulfobacterales bacterium]|nr:AMP-binding protein [Desulfobacterales bacterium]